MGTEVASARELQRVAARLRLHGEVAASRPETRAGCLGDARAKFEFVIGEVLLGNRRDLAHDTSVL